MNRDNLTEVTRTDLASGAIPAHGGRREDAARRYGIPKEELLDFSASINPLGPPPKVSAAIRRAALEIAHYPEENAAGLRRTIAEYLGVFADEIVPGNGSIEVIYWLAALLTPARVLIVEPTFSEYRRACQSAGASCHSFPLEEKEGFVLDVDRLEPKGYDLVFVCNPNNPTGYLVSVDEVAGLWRRCRAVGADLVVDEAFIDFAGENASILAYGTASGLHVVRSFTKSHALAGLRLGCLVTSSDFAARLRTLMPPWNINAFAMAAGRAALADMEFLSGVRLETAAARLRLFTELSTLPGLDPLPSEANFILCRLNGMRSEELSDRLASTGILVRDCRSFEGMDSNYIRVAVRSTRDNYQLVASLRKALS